MTALARRPAYESQCGRVLRLLERHPNQWIQIRSIHAECGPMGALHSRISELRERYGRTIECHQAGADTRYRLVTLSGDGALGRAGSPPAHNTAADAAPSPLSVGEQLRIVA